MIVAAIFLCNREEMKARRPSLLTADHAAKSLKKASALLGFQCCVTVQHTHGSSSQLGKIKRQNSLLSGLIIKERE